MATTPQFTSAPYSLTATISTANTAFDGSGAMGIIADGGTTGVRIDNIFTNATAATQVGLINLFMSSTNGANTTANTHLFRSIPVTLVNPSATTAPYSNVLSTAINADILPLFVPAGYTLRASTTIANAFRVTTDGGVF